jgi:hypothetical protein
LSDIFMLLFFFPTSEMPGDLPSAILVLLELSVTLSIFLICNTNWIPIN